MRRRFFYGMSGGINIDEYLTMEALEDDFQVLFPDELRYCIDGLKWNILMPGMYTPRINKGQTISFAGSVESRIGDVKSFTMTGPCNLLGNCMSISKETSPAFTALFRDCCQIKSVSKGFLPAVNLAESCYCAMFEKCTSLTTAPDLPAVDLEEYCYGSMFSGCTSLTSAPELPAVNLARSCYRSMFSGCTSLTSAPELPAVNLAESCYGSMFSGCTSLTTAPDLPAVDLKVYCYESMFSECTSLTSAPELPAVNLAESCYCAMFEKCTSLTTAPELPAVSMKTSCYYSMFSGCTSLTSAPELPAVNLARSCYHLMFKKCTSLTTAPELPADHTTIYCYRLMFSGCKKLNYIKMLAKIGISGEINRDLDEWVSGVSPTGTFVKNKDAAWDTTPGALGTSGVPAGWTVVNDGEESGRGEVKLISFTIVEEIFNTVEYNAIEGMTWVEWVDSEYNTGGYYIYEKHVLTPDHVDVTHSDTGRGVLADEVIISKKYTWG